MVFRIVGQRNISKTVVFLQKVDGMLIFDVTQATQRNAFATQNTTLSNTTQNAMPKIYERKFYKNIFLKMP